MASREPGAPAEDVIDVAPPHEEFDEVLRRAAEAAMDDRPFRRGRPQQHVTQRLRVRLPE